MSYALVGSVGAVTTGGGGAAISPAWGAGESRTSPNLLILWVAGLSTTIGTLPAAPAGWSIGVQKAQGTFATISIFYKIAAGADAVPTVAGIAGVALIGGLAEYSGNATSSPLDRSGSAGGTTSPLVAACGSADVAAGELVIYGCGARYSVAAAQTLTPTLNNGASANDTNDNATANANHWDFGWGVTTGNSVADQDSQALPTVSLSGAAVAVASFLLPPVVSAAAIYSPSYLPRSLGPQAVGPTFFAPLQPPYLPYFTDAPSGAIIFGGAPSESKTGSDSRSGAIIFGGAPAEQKTGADATTGAIIFGGLSGDQYTVSLPSVNQYLPFSLGPAVPLFFARFPPPLQPAASGFSIFTDAPSGALIFGGVPAEQKTGTDARSGAIIFGGAPGEAKIGTDARTGAIIFGGAANDQTTHADVRSGAIIFGGVLSPVTIYRVSPTGAIIFAGSIVESGGGTHYVDLPIGTIIFQGTVTDIWVPPLYRVQRFYNAANRNIW